MRILYCGWGGQTGQMILRAMRQLGHEVRSFYYRDEAKKTGDLTFKLYAETKAYKPDLLFIFKGELLAPEITKLVRAEGIKVAYFNTDDPQLYMKDRICRQIGLTSNYAFTCCEDTRKKYVQAGVNARLSYIGFAPEFYSVSHFDNTDEELYGCDVLIIGTCYLHATPNRVQIAQTLINEGIDLKIYGNGWAKSGIDMKHYFGTVVEYNVGKAIHGAKIVINDYYTKGDKYINLRLFEIMGMGRLMMSYRQEGVPDLFPEDKVAVYWDTLIELANKTKYYLKHEEKRNEIAKAGQQMVLTNYKTVDEVKEMLGIIQ